MRREAASPSPSRAWLGALLLIIMLAAAGGRVAAETEASDAQLAAGPSPSASFAPVSSPAAASTPSAVSAATATLLIYSGRPDPAWSLTQDDLDQLDAIAATLASVEGSPPEGDLGYKGFAVTGPQGAWRANDGLVSTPQSPPGTSLADPDRRIERFLLERGLPTLDEVEVTVGEEAIGPD